jgi:predicted metal-binding protein
LPAEVAFHFSAKGFGWDWLGKGIATTNERAEKTLSFLTCCLACPGRAMAANAAHLLHTILAEAEVIVSSISLTAHPEALHNGVPNAATGSKLLNGSDCDLRYRHLMLSLRAIEG